MRVVVVVVVVVVEQWAFKGGVVVGNSCEYKRRSKKKLGSASMGGADIEKPLLEHNQLNPVFPNCPGCKNAHLQSPDAGIPYKQFITVFLLVLCSCKYHALFCFSLLPLVLSPVFPFSLSFLPFPSSLLNKTSTLHLLQHTCYKPTMESKPGENIFA